MALYNLVKVSTSTVGTGTVTLGAAILGYLSPSQAGVPTGSVVSYGIVDGNNREVGTGTYTSATNTLTRNVINSTNSNNAISLTGSAQVYFTAISVNIADKNESSSQNFSGNVTAPTLTASGSTGTLSGRFVGSTTSGSPFTGSFVSGDLSVDRTGGAYVCTVPGSPGTWTSLGGLNLIRTDTYTTSGTYTWTKPNNAKLIYAIVTGGGGGGASGNATTGNVASAGAGAGGAAQVVAATIPAALLSSTETVVVGAGGAGGAAVTRTATANGSVTGNNGNPGGNSRFGNLVAVSGSWGQQFASAALVSPGGPYVGVTEGDPVPFAIGSGGGSGPASDNNPPGIDPVPVIGTAPGGGGQSNGPTTTAGVNGTAGASVNIIGENIAGGSGGTSGAKAGGNGTASTTWLFYGSGGGGGYSDYQAAANATGGAGGNGIRGSGGGGGGGARTASLVAGSNTATSGAGGNGGDGIVIVYTYG